MYSRDNPRLLDQKVVTGFTYKIEIEEKHFIRTIRIDHYTVSPRQSGRLMYEVFGKEEERKYKGMKPEHEAEDIVAMQSTMAKEQAAMWYASISSLKDSASDLEILPLDASD